MTKPGHSEAEDSMEGAFATIVVIVLLVVAVVIGSGYLLVTHLLNHQFIK